MKKGDWIMMFFTVNIIFMCWFSLWKGRAMDGSIAVCYSAAIGVYVARKGAKDYQEGLRLKPGEEKGSD